MSVAVVDCAVWNEISKETRQGIEKRNLIQLVQRLNCLGFSDKDRGRVSSQCLACSNFFKNKVKAEIKVKVV